MLSYTVSLLRKATFKGVEKQSLWLIFSTVYLDMYDMALYLGYAIYLAPVLLPGIHVYKVGFILSLILFFSQLAKFIGFIHFNLSSQNTLIDSSRRFLFIALGYIIITILISGYIVNNYAIVLFIIVRILQGYLMGIEIAFVINFASISMSRKYHSFIYYFIMFSSELGALICIFFNRLLVTHDISFVVTDRSWLLQTMVGASFAVILALMHFIYPLPKKRYHDFIVQSFIKSIKQDGVSIILRSGIVLCHVVLIFIVIFRIPTILHLGLGWSIHEVNHLVLLMTGCAFLGTNTVTIIIKFIKPLQILRFSFLVCICVAISWLKIGSSQDHKIYSFILYAMAYVYGIFIRVTPLYLYHVRDMCQRRWLISRYLAYIFTYSFLGSLSVLMLDLLHFVHHTYYDSGPPILLLFVSSLGFIALIFYLRRITNR